MSLQAWVFSVPTWCVQAGQLLAALCAGGIGALFLVAGVAKLRAHDAFLGTLASYRLLPEWLYESAAWALAITETGLALLLFSGRGAFVGSVAAAALLVVFACAMGVNVLRGRTDLSCGCTPGVAGQKLSWAVVLRTLVCALCALVPCVGLALVGGLSPAVWVCGVAGGVCVYLLWQAMQVLPPVRVPGSGEYGA
ncbi:MauE/DoxX family redox-associated membrane protein [Acetobacter okinawensis]|uniref:MauE/DoxX family redox-associated membrane protein n=1 Tax=Acetobacter okinawensis TaxID=1076594 RepID=UPI000A3776D2|nr:MauE/DoxX family redox-associated membrane protein [Acetobacter okinawensis]